MTPNPNNTYIELEILPPDKLIKVLKAYSGFTNTGELADELGIGKSTLHAVESGKDPCGYKVLNALVMRYKLNIQTFSLTVNQYNAEVMARKAN